MTFALRLWYQTSIRTGSEANMQPLHGVSASGAARRARNPAAPELRHELPIEAAYAKRGAAMALTAQGCFTILALRLYSTTLATFQARAEKEATDLGMNSPTLKQFAIDYAMAHKR